MDWRRSESLTPTLLVACVCLCGAVPAPRAAAGETAPVSRSDQALLEDLELLRDWELLVNWDPQQDLPIPVGESALDGNGAGGSEARTGASGPGGAEKAE